jgi:HSP20 family protein
MKTTKKPTATAVRSKRPAVKKAAPKPVTKPVAKAASPSVPAKKEVQIISSPFWNIWDAGEEFKVRISIPGISKKDIKVKVNGNQLTIGSSKESNREEKRKNYLVQEYSFASWSRTIALPQAVSAADMKVKYKEGVLKLDLKKSVIK